MIPFLLFALFFMILLSRSLGLETSLAPGLSVKNAFLYLIFLSLAIETVVTRQRRLELMPVIVPFVLYVIYAIFSWLVVLLIIDYPNYSLLPTAISLKGGPVEELLVLLIFFYGVNDQRQALWLLHSMLWLVIVANIVMVIDSLNVPDLGFVELGVTGRATGVTGNAVTYGVLLVFFLPSIVVMYQTATGIKKSLAGIGLVLSGLALVMTVSRGAFVGLVCGSIFSAYYLRKYIPSRVMIRAGLGAALLCLIVLVGAIAAGFLDIVLERFGAIGSNIFDATSGRNVIWGRMLGRMFDYPITFLTGFGWDAYESLNLISTHSVYLNILYNLGAIGLGLYLLVVANALRVGRAVLDTARPDARPLIVAFVFGFSALLVSIAFVDYYHWLYIWAYTAVLLRLAVSQSGTESASVRGKRRRLAAAADSN